MKYFVWFLLPLFGLALVIQMMVIEPLSGNSHKSGAAIIQDEVNTMPLYAASKKKNNPVQKTNQTTDRTSAGGDDLAQFQQSINQIFAGIRSVEKKETCEVQAPTAPSTFEAVVVKVYDGDTFTVDVKGTETKIRLAAVDAPELKQVGGEDAQKYLSSLISNKLIKIEPVDTDRYGRLIAFVYVDGKEINERLVKEGRVWFYKEYANGHDYYNDMVWAMNQKIGIWKTVGILPPALYRKLATLGKLGANIIKNGLYLDDKGILHNKNIPCKSSFPSKWRWNGIDNYDNCPVCYGAIYSPRGILGSYLNDASSEALVEDSFDPDVSTDIELESHVSGEEISEPIQADDYKPATVTKPVQSSCPTCNTWRWF